MLKIGLGKKKDREKIIKISAFRTIIDSCRLRKKLVKWVSPILCVSSRRSCLLNVFNRVSSLRLLEFSMHLPMVDTNDTYCLEDLTTSWTRLIRDVIVNIVSVSVDVLVCLDWVRNSVIDFLARCFCQNLRFVKTWDSLIPACLNCFVNLKRPFLRMSNGFRVIMSRQNYEQVGFQTG